MLHFSIMFITAAAYCSVRETPDRVVQDHCAVFLGEILYSLNGLRQIIVESA